MTSPLPEKLSHLLEALGPAAAHPALTAGTAITAVAGVVAVRNVVAAKRHRHHAEGARVITIAPPPAVDPASAYALWAHLQGLLQPARWKRRLWGMPHLVWQYNWTGRRLSISVWVPGTVPPGSVEAAVKAAWPASSCTTAPAAPLFAGAALPAATGGQLAYTRAEWLPLETRHVNDPLRPLMSATTTLPEGQHAIVQILARPARHHRAARARQAIARLRAGKPAGGTPDLAAPITGLMGLFLPGNGGKAGGNRTPAKVRDPFADRDAKAGTEKVAFPLWETSIRYAVAAGTRSGAPPGPKLKGTADAIASAFSIFSGHNTLGRRRKLRAPLQVIDARRMRYGQLTSLPELAALAALPQDVAVPGLSRAAAKSVPAPVAVPSGGRNLKILGTAQEGGQKAAITAADARYHLHVLGATGSGKSTLLTNMIIDDIEACRGVVVIDPHGDLILDVLERVPADRLKDRLVLIDPDQPNPPRFNPLQGHDEDLTVDNLVSIFGSIFQNAWGPRMDDVMRVSCLTLMRHQGVTLGMIPLLLNSDQFAAQMTAELGDPAGLGGFWDWYATLQPGLRSQVVGPVLARLRAFLLKDFVRNTLSVPTSSFDMGKVLDGGVLLARLPKGILGLETTRLMGSMLLARVWQAASARASIATSQRRDASVYLDEAQNFLTLGTSVADMLAEARKYRLSMVLAHQHLGQFYRELLQAVSANARSKVFFQCSPGDAKYLEEHTLPELDAHDLSHLDKYVAAARLMADERTTPAFTLATRPPRPVIGELTAIRHDAAAATPPRQTAPMEKLADTIAERDRERHDGNTNSNGPGSKPRQQRPKGTKPSPPKQPGGPPPWPDPLPGNPIGEIPPHPQQDDGDQPTATRGPDQL